MKSGAGREIWSDRKLWVKFFIGLLFLASYIEKVIKTQNNSELYLLSY